MYLKYQRNIKEIFNNEDACKNLESTKETLNKVSYHLTHHKERVRRNVEGKSSKSFFEQMQSDLCIIGGDKLLKETNDIVKKTEENSHHILEDANSELISIDNNIWEATVGLQIAERIIRIQDLFEEVEISIIAKKYSSTLLLLQKLQELISIQDELIPDKVFQKCDCYESIKTKYFVQSHLLKQILFQRFETLLQFKEKEFNTSKSITIQIASDECQWMEIIETISEVNYNWKKISDFLLHNCLEPFIKKPVSFEVYNGNIDYAEIRISYSLQQLKQIMRPSYKQVFKNIQDLFNSLAKINFKISNDRYLFSIIGENINDIFLPMLVTECLNFAIPETLEDYKECSLLMDVKSFQTFLCKVNLLTTQNDSHLSKFCVEFHKSFNTRFLNKLLKVVKDIASKDLQDMVLSTLPNFPVCMLSKSVTEFTKILEHLVGQTLILKEWQDEQFIPNAINILLTTYIVQVPNVHRKLLESIPQQAALFYNNCMFISFWISEHFEKDDPLFDKLLKQVQSAGYEFLNLQTASQKKIVVKILSDIEFSNHTPNGMNSLKLVRQSMRQLELLRNVWQNVLPDDIYDLTFFEILNVVCIEMTRRIMSLEDISVTLATDLGKLLSVVLEKAPEFFKEKHKVVNIKTWTKVEQLKTILNASLQEIEDLWCGGAGPLTLNFTPEEVKFLIRALFQNTDRRARTLSKII